MTAKRYVRASAFTLRMGWAQTTVYKKLFLSRRKKANGVELSPFDLPLPDDETEGPRWLQSTLDKFAEQYEAARSGDLPAAEAPTPPESPGATP